MSRHTKRGPYGFPVYGFFKGTCTVPYRHALLPKASSRSLLHVYEQQRLWRDCTYAQSCLSHCLWPLFSPVLAHINIFCVHDINQLICTILTSIMPHPVRQILDTLITKSLWIFITYSALIRRLWEYTEYIIFSDFVTSQFILDKSETFVWEMEANLSLTAMHTFLYPATW